MGWITDIIDIIESVVFAVLIYGFVLNAIDNSDAGIFLGIASFMLYESWLRIEKKVSK